MLDDDGLERIDDLARYRPAGGDGPRSVAASGYAISDLYRGELLSEVHMEVLAEVADVVGTGGRICETEELLDAWIETFEVLSSVWPDDLPGPTDTTTRGDGR
ncbi:hypothetical protein [Pseudonocardia sp.]|uniref:hypothetical protein n=1 Tax=Pseudonocardia sp. TaxID=60912 RepID=UPI002618368D|nr:hypothetical protein [Pseudonocardia sp.]